MGSAYRLTGAYVNSSVIGGITNQQLSPGVQTLIQGGSGSVEPTWGGVMKIMPVLSFTTVHIAQALSAIPLMTGRSGTNGQCKLAFENVETGAYLTLTPYKWLAVIRSIDASQDQEASCNVSIMAIGDTSNAPLAISTTASPMTKVVSEKFTIGPVVVNGSISYETQSISIDPSIEESMLSDSGALWPTSGYIRSNREPKISVATRDLSKSLALMATTNAGLTLTGIVAYFRKKVEGGAGNAANNAGSHIAISGTKGVAYISDLSGAHGSESTLQVDASLVNDGINSALLVSTAASIG